MPDKRKYIALLRGVNVGGNNKIDMRALKAAFERRGFQSVYNAITIRNANTAKKLAELAGAIL